MITKIIAHASLNEYEDNLDQPTAVALINETLLAPTHIKYNVSAPVKAYSEIVDQTIQIYATAKATDSYDCGELAALTALYSLKDQIKSYSKEAASKRIDYADFADRLSEAADHAVRTALTAWQGLTTGTSLAWLLVEENIAYTYSVGNNVIYLYRKQNLHKITGNKPQLKEGCKINHLGYRNPDIRLEPANLNRMPLKKGDKIILASIDASQYLNQTEVENTIKNSVSFFSLPDSICQKLRQAGCQDDISMIVFDVQGQD